MLQHSLRNLAEWPSPGLIAAGITFLFIVAMLLATLILWWWERRL